MQDTVAQRIKLLINSLGENQNSFSKKIGVTPSTIATAIERDKGVNTDLIHKIINVFTNVSTEWLITGNGEMLRDNKRNENKSIPDTLYSNIENKYPVVSEPDVKCSPIPSENTLVKSLLQENNTLQVRVAVLEAENKGLQNENKNLQKTIEDKQVLYQQIIENKQVEIDRCLSEIENKQSIIENFISGKITATSCSGSKGSKATG